MQGSPSKRAKKTFRLRDHVQGDDFKLLVTMPAEDFLAKVENLEAQYSEDVLNCLRNIYSYVAERNYVEDTDTFFHHVASAVLYEASQGVLIKGRDHAKKAASIVKMIANTLTRHAEYVPNDDNELEVVEEVEGLLIHHGILIENAIRLKDPITLAHLAEHCQYHCNSMAEWVLDKADKQRNRSGIHTEKTPKKTPKRLTSPASKSVKSLRASAAESKAKRAIIFVEDEAMTLNKHLDDQDSFHSSEDEDDILTLSNPTMMFSFNMGSMKESLPNLSDRPPSDGLISSPGKKTDSNRY